MAGAGMTSNPINLLAYVPEIKPLVAMDAQAHQVMKIVARTSPWLFQVRIGLHVNYDYESKSKLNAMISPF